MRDGVRERKSMGGLDRVAEGSARASFHLFIGNFLSEVINAVGAVVVARLLTPGEYGVYSLAFVLPGIFVMFSNWGIASALTRFIARFQSRGRWTDVRRIVRIGFLFNGAMACCLSVVMFLAADFLAAGVLRRPEMGGLVGLMSVLVVFQSVFNMASSVFYGLERMDLMAAMMVVQSVVKALASSLLVIRGYGVKGAVVGHLLGMGTAAAASPLLILRYSKGKHGADGPDHEEDSSLKGMLRFGFPLFLGNFLETTGSRYQGLLLAWFADNVAIGNLNVANKFRSLVTLFTVPIRSVLYPAFSKFDYGEHPEELKRIFRVSVRYATMLVVPAVALILLLSEQLVTFLFGSEYRLAPSFLSLVLIQFLPVALGSLSVFGFLNSQGDTVTSLRLKCVNVGLMMTACTVLSWKMGVLGLLTGIFISMMAGNAYNLYRLYSRYGIWIDSKHAVVSVLFSSLSASIAYASLRALDVSHTLVELAVGSMIFFLACLLLAPLTGAVVERDLQNLRRILKRETSLYPFIAPLLDLEGRIIQLKER